MQVADEIRYNDFPEAVLFLDKLGYRVSKIDFSGLDWGVYPKPTTMPENYPGLIMSDLFSPSPLARLKEDGLLFLINGQVSPVIAEQHARIKQASRK